AGGRRVAVPVCRPADRLQLLALGFASRTSQNKSADSQHCRPPAAADNPGSHSATEHSHSQDHPTSHDSLPITYFVACPFRSQQAVGVLLYLYVVELIVCNCWHWASHHAPLRTKAPTASIAASQPLMKIPAATAQPSIPTVKIIRPAMTASPSRTLSRVPSDLSRRSACCCTCMSSS